MGAEFAPLHLHGTASVREFEGLNAVIAASYGDMVGRGEFSGRWLYDLESMVPGRLNRFGLLKSAIVRGTRAAVEEDAWGYRKRLVREQEFQYREIEHHLHYTRRMLQGAMGLLWERLPFFQLFTAPATFRLMWSLDPRLRRDSVYLELLQSLPDKVREIPWARTGNRFGTRPAAGDRLSRTHHVYGRWLRRDLRDEVRALAGGDGIRDLGIFNDRALDTLLKIWPVPRTTTTNALDGIVSWLASLAVCIATYSIRGRGPPSTTTTLDLLEGFWGPARACGYLAAREFLRT